MPCPARSGEQACRGANERALALRVAERTMDPAESRPASPRLGRGEPHRRRRHPCASDAARAVDAVLASEARARRGRRDFGARARQRGVRRHLPRSEADVARARDLLLRTRRPERPSLPLPEVPDDGRRRRRVTAPHPRARRRSSRRSSNRASSCAAIRGSRRSDGRCGGSVSTSSPSSGTS